MKNPTPADRTEYFLYGQRLKKGHRRKSYESI